MRLVLFVEPEPVEAVLAVLEMVLAMAAQWMCLPLGCATGGLGGATGDDVKGRVDVPFGRGSPAWCVRALAPRRRCAEALASVLRRVRVLCGGLGGACAPCVTKEP